jgi:hypothetical protein
LAGQTPQLPFVHVCPDGQTFPHAPQLFGSFVMSTQAPLQTVSLPGSFGTHTLFTRSSHGPHGGWQLPPMHSCPAGHTLPHWPQLFRSPNPSMHCPLQ